MDHGRRYGGQCVVVSELDFRNRQRVVLVHDGDDAHV